MNDPTLLQTLAADGSLVGTPPALPDEDLLAMYEQMTLLRTYDERSVIYHRQGRIGTYAIYWGHEAMQVGSAFALEEQDWLFPTYRDCMALVARGVDPVETLGLLRGDWHLGYDPYEHKVAPQTTPLATQLPHAVGVAHAARLKGEDTVVMALVGDGGTSEGDFHEALNFAAVFQAPVVFFIQNNEPIPFRDFCLEIWKNFGHVCCRFLLLSGTLRYSVDPSFCQ